MNFGRTFVAAVVLGLLVTAAARAATIPFDFSGKAGAGIKATNENHVINGTPGSGGELGAGLSYNDSTNVLSMVFGWGTGNGFTNLTGTTTGGHIHGPTASN